LPYKDREIGRAHQREYYKRPEVIERIRQRENVYSQRPEVKERRRQRAKEYLQRPGVKERLNKLSNEERRKTKYEVLGHYSKKLSNSDFPSCNCCGEHDFLIFLTIDHITNRKKCYSRKGFRW